MRACVRAWQGIDRYTSFIARRVAAETRTDIQNAMIEGVGTKRGDVVNLLSSVLGRVVDVLANAESLAKANFQSVRARCCHCRVCARGVRSCCPCASERARRERGACHLHTHVGMDVDAARNGR